MYINEVVCVMKKIIVSFILISILGLLSPVSAKTTLRYTKTKKGSTSKIFIRYYPIPKPNFGGDNVQKPDPIYTHGPVGGGLSSAGNADATSKVRKTRSHKGYSSPILFSGGASKKSVATYSYSSR